MRRFFPSRRAFVLLEAMLAVFIFSFAALGLGRCVQNCLRAELYRREESLAQRALANYWTQVEMGAIPLASDQVSEDLKGAWTGMKIFITREPLTLRNENDQEMYGLFTVTIAIRWGAKGNEQERSMAFIHYPRNR